MVEDREPGVGGEPPAGGGRLSGRGLWFGAAALIIVVIVALVLVWVLPSSNEANSEEPSQSEQPVEEEVVEEEEPVEDAGGEQAAEEQGGEEQGGGGVTVTPSEDSSGYTVEFPEPADMVEEPAPEKGYTDIAGLWVIDMDGSIYELANCYLRLEDGRITSPNDYNSVFEILSSEYSWDGEGSIFNASLQIIVKLGSDQMSVPATLKLTGTVDASLVQIAGDFSAEPQGEAYAMYGEKGTFTMHR